MDCRIISITGSAFTQGRLNIRSCGRDFFPAGAFGEPAKANGRGGCLKLQVRGLPAAITTDIPTDTHGRPRWFFRERSWVKKFVQVHGLCEGDEVLLRRLSSHDYEIAPFRENGTGKLFPQLDIPAERSAPKPSKRLRRSNGNLNKLDDEDRPVHDWYRFVLSYPPHLVREYLGRFKVSSEQCVLDPFCGTGTTLVECQKQGIPSIGIEANPVAFFASSVKADWAPDPDGLLRHAREVAQEASGVLAQDGISDDPVFLGQAPAPRELRRLSQEQQALLLANSISELPLHKALVLLDAIQRSSNESYCGHEKLALAKAVVFEASNLHFGPEVGVGKKKPDVAMIGPWLSSVQAMAKDLAGLPRREHPRAQVCLGDARNMGSFLRAHSVDAVITSPPYPNEKDYTRTTRLESVLLGFLKNKGDLRALKHSMVRSNTRGVYRGDDDDKWVSQHPEIQVIADAIEARRIELGKTSGFERLYHRVTKLYFGGMARHLSQLAGFLRPGARLAYVVGDQASYLRVMIRTGEILGRIAESIGYEVESIDLFRTRLSTTTRDQLREEVVVLRWPGTTKAKKAQRKG